VILVSVDELRRLCVRSLESVGARTDEAKIVAENLVKADLRGTNSHGVFRLPEYLERVKRGLINISTEIEIIREGPSFAVIDGKAKFGQVVGTRAMDLAISKGKKAGLALVTVSKSNHFGIASYYSMFALKHMMIGIVMSNAAPSMAPWGAKEKLFGTNPLSVAIPTGGPIPIVLDMAMSQVARGKIRMAADKGERIPEGWAVDKEGRATTDPVAALEGSLAPIAGAKGSGLAIVIDVLCGVLSGGTYGNGVKSMYDMTGPCGTCNTMIAIDISKFIPVDRFTEQVKAMIGAIKGSSLASGFSRIFLPGEIEIETERNRLTQGIPFEEETWARLNRLLDA